jgi:hypothetical protein
LKIEVVQSPRLIVSKLKINNLNLIASRVRATPSLAMPAICLDERVGDDMEDILPEDDEGELIPRHTAPDRIKPDSGDQEVYDDIDAKLRQ